MNQTSFHEILRDQFLKRNCANPRYSLRAFARDLEMEPAQLSRIFQGKQNLSSGKAKWVAKQIFDSEAEREYFVLLVELTTAKRTREKNEATLRISRLQESGEPNVSPDALLHLSSWLHIAILDLLSLKPFSKGAANEMAKLLGVTPLEVKLAIQSLLRAGFVNEKRGKLEKANSTLRTTSGIPSETIRTLHKQFAQKAYEAVDTQNVEERYFISKTFSIAREDLPKVKSLIDELNRKVSEIAAGSKAKNELYQLNMQCFRLLKGEKL